MYLFRLLALIVQWLGHLVVAEKTWVRFPLGAHNNVTDSIGSIHQKQILQPKRFFSEQLSGETVTPVMQSEKMN
jgi:hypothetical protein